MHQHSHPISVIAFESCTQLSVLEVDGEHNTLGLLLQTLPQAARRHDMLCIG